MSLFAANARAGKRKFAAGANGLKAPFKTDRLNPTCTATCPCETVLLIRRRWEFVVVFEGYVGRAEHWP